MGYLTIIGGVFVAWLILVVLFAPHIPYHVEAPVDPSSEHFIHVIESTCNTRLDRHNQIEILTNGTVFYPAMIDAIRGALETINLECYIFKKGEVADRFVDALCERAGAGVHITIVLDAVGSFGAFRQVAKRLSHASCRVERYQRARWHSLARLNNRTHRELLVIDGRVAFVGGAGVADRWFTRTRDKPMWRDMMARIEGPIVPNIQGIVAENWLECSGDAKMTSMKCLPCRILPSQCGNVSSVSYPALENASRTRGQSAGRTNTSTSLVSRGTFE